MSTAATMARRPPVTPAPFVSNTQLAMAAVIVGELMMFGGLVGMYLLFRLQAEVWPPAGLPRLPLGVTSLNTLVLIASAWPMHRALAAVRAGRQDAAAGAATWAAALGALFLLIQGVEWARLVSHGLSLGSGAYGGAFYVLIGCHAVHVLVAVGFVVAVAALLRRGVLHAERLAPVEMCATYWYFVVALWLGLFPLVYWY
jgi:cytochrome c oxidase subunit 3